MVDKFTIFQKIILKELETNHNHIYISIFQLAEIMNEVDRLNELWDENISIDANMDKHFDRKIIPLGNAGTNRI